MGHHPFDFNVLQRGKSPREARDLVGAEPKPPHARVDLDVYPEPPPVEPFDPAKHLLGNDSWGKIVISQGVKGFPWHDAAQDQDRNGDAPLSESPAFLDKGNAEILSAQGLKS